MTDQDKQIKLAELAEKAVSLSIGTILLNMRFFARAVNRLSPVPYCGSYACDGKHLMYDPEYLLRRYRQSERLPVHDCLHMLMHCVFRHWHTGQGIDRALWDAACDIAAEAQVMHIGAVFCSNERETDKKEVIEELSSKVRPLTAEKLYAYFVKSELSEKRAEELCRLFITDDHSRWHRDERDREKEPEETTPMISPEVRENDGSENDDRDSGIGDDDTDREDQQKEDQPEQGTPDADSGGADLSEEFARRELVELAKQWEQISKEIQSELENFDRQPGKDSRLLTQALEDVNRERYDYREFLRRFAVTGEVMRCDPDSFDTGFYCYGLSLYGNVALVEPPEYKETSLIRDFVIAIDTSGSVSGRTVQCFMQKTYNILMCEESFFSKINVYIIQCDTEVRDAVKITCRSDLEKYIRTMELKGLGGTDFRPVFDHIAELRKNGELTALRGLIYFTDGIGSFPELPPDYQCAFVFIRSDYDRNEQPAVPPWAIRLILEDEEVFDER